MTPTERFESEDDGLAQLTTDLRDERPEPDPDFAAQLDRWAAAGFPRGQRPGPAEQDGLLDRLRAWLSANPPRRLVAPVGAVATLAIVVGLAISVSEGPRSGDDAGLESADSGGDAASVSQAEDAGGKADVVLENGDRSLRREEAVTQEALAKDDVQATSGFRNSSPSAAGAVASDQRKVATTADLVLASEPDEVRDVSDRVNEVVNRYRGIVVSSSVQSGDAEGAGLGSNFQLRIPAANLQAALADLSELAHVQSRTESTEDITGKFISAQERIDELEASRESVLNQLAEADTEAEADALRRQLRSLNSQLSAVRAELEDARQRVQLVPVSVSIVAEEGAGDDGDWGIGEALDDAGQVLSTAAGIAVVAGAVLLPLALIALVVALVLRTRTGRAREGVLDE